MVSEPPPYHHVFSAVLVVDEDVVDDRWGSVGVEKEVPVLDVIAPCLCC